MTKGIFVGVGYVQDERWWLHKYSLWPGWLGTFIDIIYRLTSSLILWLFVLSLLHHSCIAAVLPFMERLQLMCCRSYQHSWMFLQLITSPLSLLGLWWEQVEILDKFTSAGFLVSGGTQSWLFFSEDTVMQCVWEVCQLVSLSVPHSLFPPSLCPSFSFYIDYWCPCGCWSRRSSCSLCPLRIITVMTTDCLITHLLCFLRMCTCVHTPRTCAPVWIDVMISDGMAAKWCRFMSCLVRSH